MSHANIAIIGAGIGGLTAALALAQRGHAVQVFEQASALATVGAGIQLGPNATRILQSLGLQRALTTITNQPQAINLKRFSDGKPLNTLALNGDSPYYVLHRADLITLLAHAAETAGAQIQFNAHVDDITALDQHLIIGADGIHSHTRKQLFSPTPARFTGNIAWRGLVPLAQFPELAKHNQVTAWLGPKRHFVHYILPHQNALNIIAIVEQKQWLEEDWQIPGEIAELAAAFRHWHPQVQQLIHAIDPNSCAKWGLFDRQPQRPWHKNNVVLLGDACHAMLPFLAQGAAMAIEDAWVLANTFDSRNLQASLAAYEQQRFARTARMQRESRANAWRYHLSNPILRHTRDWILQRRPNFVAKKTAWIYEY